MADSRFPYRHDDDPSHEERRATRISAGTVGTGGILGLGAVALAIIGLAGVNPPLLCAIAIIVAGAGFVLKGGAIAGGYAAVASVATRPTEPFVVEGGTSVDVTAGLGGIGLGILALLGVIPRVLDGVAVIAFGAALVMSSGAIARLESLARSVSESAHGRGRYSAVSAGSTQIAVGLHILAGLAAAALGIISLSIGTLPQLLLSLTAVLITGAMLFISGTAISGRLGGLEKNLTSYREHREEDDRQRRQQMP